MEWNLHHRHPLQYGVFLWDHEPTIDPMRQRSILHQLFVVLVLPLTLVTCKQGQPVPPEPELIGTLRVVIRPTWDGMPFHMNEVYHNVSGYRVKVEALKFYLGDVRFVDDGFFAAAKDVSYFDLQHDGDTVVWNNVPTGTWTSLRMGLGVPQALNDADPIVYPPGHPLSLALGTYWTWATAYRFVMFDGRYDLDGAGTGPVQQPFSMHTGVNVCYREFDLPLATPLVVNGTSTSTVVLELAVDRFFHSDGEVLDLATENQTHGNDPAHVVALKLTNNVINAFSAQ